MARTDIAGALAARPRVRLATLPTPLEPGPELAGGGRLWVKRDDLTGLGMGGNKARKLEYLCGAAIAAGADTLVTVGAAQSNHCRMTAAAGAVLGLDVHLVVGGAAPERPEGNQRLSLLFGAHLHYAGTDDWGELEAAKETLAAELTAGGRRAAAIPIGGSTLVGALGFLGAFAELMSQAEALGVAPRTIVTTTSSGGTHAGLLAGRAAQLAAGRPAPDIVGIAVAPEIAAFPAATAHLAAATLAEAGLAGEIEEATIDDRWLGPGYGVATADGDAAIRWAARHGAWVLDRTYTGKGFAGLLGLAGEGRWPPGADVVFWHTGGQPAVFTSDGSPSGS
jgi:1-aminocyclopropane-1-carboxylate deaminase/D-cysteine desulfhydrase-like pyridoxal-dependent ACC family enzyme